MERDIYNSKNGMVDKLVIEHKTDLHDSDSSSSRRCLRVMDVRLLL